VGSTALIFIATFPMKSLLDPRGRAIFSLVAAFFPEPRVCATNHTADWEPGEVDETFSSDS